MMARLIALIAVAIAVTTQTPTSRRGALDTVARCSTDGAKTWSDDVLLSNRGFTSIYGHYGGAAISSRGRLFVVWAEGERDNRTGTVWFNSVPLRH
jgi:hypothetical protein